MGSPDFTPDEVIEVFMAAIIVPAKFFAGPVEVIGKRGGSLLQRRSFLHLLQRHSKFFRAGVWAIPYRWSFAANVLSS
jgi:hypothetical protein